MYAPKIKTFAVNERSILFTPEVICSIQSVSEQVLNSLSTHVVTGHFG